MKISPLTLRELNYHAELPPFPHLLNLWAVEDEAVIGLDLQFSFVYEIVGPDLLHKPESELADFSQSIKNFLHSLPENIALQFVVQCRSGDPKKIADYEKTVSSTEAIARLIVDAKKKHLSSVFLQRRRTFMFLTTYPDKTDLLKFKGSSFSLVNTDYKKITKAVHESRIHALKDLHSRLIPALQSAGLRVNQMKRDAILSLLYEYLNPSRVRILDPRTLSSEEPLRSQMALNACKLNFDHNYMDGVYSRAVNLYARPESIHYPMILQFLDRLTPEYDLVVTVQTGDQEQFEKEINFGATLARIIGGINPFKRYHEATLKAEHSENLIEHVKATFQKLYNVSFCLILRERSLEKLTAKTNQAVQNFRLIGEAEGVIDDMNHLPLFLSALPGHSHLNLRKFVFQTEAVAQILPISAPWTGSKEPKLIFQTDDNQLLPLDLFDPSLPAKHGLVIGSTGSGKSFGTNFLLTNFFIESEKNHVVIIDVGGSYRKFSNIFGGQYLEVELSEKFAFNPFPPKEEAVRNSDPAKFEVDADTVSFLTLLIQKMLNLQSLSGHEQTILESAITNAYRFSKTNPPILSSVHYQLLHYEGDGQDKEIALNFAKNLQIWTTGRYGKLLNQEHSLKTDARLVVFDLQKLNDQPDLQTIIFFLIKSVIAHKLKDLSLKKMIVIDEGWKFFSDEVGSQLIMDLYRTARKFNGMVLSISQNPEDFLATKAATSIISNSYTKYILRLKKGHELLPQFQLNSPEIETIKNLTSQQGIFSEVFLKFNENSRVLKIQPSRTDYWICTTDADDKVTEDKFREEHPGLSEMEVIDGLSKLEVKK